MLQGKGRVLQVLIEGIDPAVADGEACKVDPRIILELEGACHDGDVVASEALTGDDNLTTAEFRVLNHEIVEEDVEIFRQLRLCEPERSDAVYEAEAGAEGLVNVHHVCFRIPRKVVLFQHEWVLDVLCVELEVVGTVLGEEAEH